MDWGIKNRLSRIILRTDNRALMLAVDHGYFLGPTEKLEVPKKTIAPLLKHCDSLMITRGVQRTSVDATYPIPIVLRVSGGPSIIGEDLSNEEITTSIKEAIRLNACAVAMSIFVGSKNEKQTVVNLGKLVNEAEEYGIPVLAVTAVGKEMVRDARYLSLACRIAAEQGAHIVKTYYCDDFEKVVQSCPVPIIIAGGKKLPEKDALKLTYDALKAGASGVDMGRNIWQSENPVPMIKAVRAIVHQNYNVEEAWKLYIKLCNEKKSKPQEQNQTKSKSDRPNTNNRNKPNTNNRNKPNTNNKNKPNTNNKNKPNTNNRNKPNTNNKNKPNTDNKNKPNTDNKNKPNTDNKKN